MKKKRTTSLNPNTLPLLIILLSLFTPTLQVRNWYGQSWCPYSGFNKSYDKPRPPQIVRYGGYNPWHYSKNYYKKEMSNHKIGYRNQWWAYMKLGANLRIDDQNYWSDVRVLDALLKFKRYGVLRYEQILRLRIYRGWLQFIWAAGWRRTSSIWDTWTTFDVAYPRYWWEAHRRWGYSGRHRFHYGRRHIWHSLQWFHMNQWRRRWFNIKIIVGIGHWWAPSIGYPWGGKYHYCASRVLLSVNNDRWMALGCNGWTNLHKWH